MSESENDWEPIENEPLNWHVPYIEVPWDTPPSTPRKIAGNFTPPQSPRELKELAVALQKALAVATPTVATVSNTVHEPVQRKRRCLNGGT
jgi:hypothetical protein